jgi:hypothetical protein
VEIDPHRINVVIVQPGAVEASEALHDAVRDALVWLGLGVRSMKRQTRTLESMFFEATQ